MPTHLLRFLGLIALWLVCLGIALAGGWPAMWLVVYALGLLLVGSFAWAQLNVSGLALVRQARVTRLQVGEPLDEHIRLSTTGGISRWWPRVWLELHDRTDFPDHHLDSVLFLASHGQRTWDVSSVAQQRGRYQLGPVWVASTDPFGVVRAARQLTGASTVIVYPRTVDLPRFGRTVGDLPGAQSQAVRVPFSTPSASSIREYQTGDAFSRIHWPSVARTGRLFVREFEQDPTTDVWIVLDLCAPAQAGHGPESTEEYAVTAAASLARHLLFRGRSVGLVTQSTVLPADRGERQYERILEVLAVVRATSALTLDALLLAETSRFTRGSEILLVTPTTDEHWVTICQTLRARGVRSTAVLVEAATFGAAAPLLLLVSTAAAARIPTYLIKRGEPLERSLSAPRSFSLPLD